MAAPLTAREEVRQDTAHGGLYLRRAQLGVSPEGLGLERPVST